MSKVGIEVLRIAKGYLGTTDGSPFMRRYNERNKASIPLNAAWCAAFASDIYRMAGVPTNSAPDAVGCTTIMNWYKNRLRWKTRGSYIPLIGDSIIFDWDLSGDGDHIGLVDYVKNGVVYTIEGNAGNMGKCEAKSYSLTSSIIRGYGVPLFNLEEEVPEMTEAEMIALVKKTYDQVNPIYTNTNQVPDSWKQDVIDMVNEGLIKGDGKTQLGNMRDDTLRALIVARRGIQAEHVNYRTLEDVPKWGQPAVKNAMDQNFIKGKAVASDGTVILDLSEDLLRVIQMFFGNKEDTPNPIVEE